MNIVRLCIHGLLVICCALLISILFITNDPIFKNSLQSKLIHMLSKSLDCEFNTAVADINIATGTVTLHDTHVRENNNNNNNNWSWHAQKIDIQISLLESFLKKKVVAQISIDNISMISNINDGGLAILPHLKKYVSSSLTPFPFEAQKLTINQGNAIIQCANVKSICAFHGHAALIKQDQIPQAYLFCVALDEGNIDVHTTTVIHDLQGTVEGQIALSKKQESRALLKGLCSMPHQPVNDQLCKVDGSFTPHNFQLHCATDTQQIVGDLKIDYQQNQYTLQTSVPLNYLTKHLGISMPTLNGLCSINASGKPTALPTTTTLQISADQCSYNKIILPSIQAHLTYQTNSTLQGTIQCTYNNQSIVEGSCVFDIQNMTGTCCCANTAPLKLAKKTFEPKSIIGSLQITKDHIALQGTSEQCTYDLRAQAHPRWHLKHCNCSWQGKPVINLTATSPTQFSGIIGYPVVKFLTQLIGCYAPGGESIQVAGTFGNTMTFDVSMKDGNIRLPYTYNLLQDIQTTIAFDTQLHRFAIKNLDLQFNKGNLQASLITGILNERHQLAYLHAPIIFDNCFFGINKDLFAFFSGTLTSTYQPDGVFHVGGSITLDRAHIRNNILSGEFRTIFGTTAAPFSQKQNVDFDVKVMTHSPIRVKTSFLEAAAHIHAHLTDSISEPTISGSVEITNGSFLFPYKPLLIKRGKLYFLPHQTNDPVVDILAENNIRKYAVHMAVNGTVKNPNIAFSSTPQLQEEQIVALLLGGSEDGSLFLAMPTSIMKSIQNLLFGPAHTTSQFQRTLKNLFSPLKNLRITPSFSDQTARGGLRGSLIIDVNDRLRAIIEQNFSLTEDVVIQVEYDLSDDARIRATRDERGDLGGELEGRWKF